MIKKAADILLFPESPTATGTLTAFSLENTATLSISNARAVSSAPLDPTHLLSTAAAVPLGLSSAQDFPPLAAPSQPSMPVAPKLQRKTTTKIATTGIKPVVPVLSANVLAKSTAKTPHSFGDQLSSDNKDTDSIEKAISESNDVSGALHPVSKVEGKKPEIKGDDVLMPVEKKQDLATLKSGDKRGRPEKLDLGVVNQGSIQGIGGALIQKNSTTATADQSLHNQAFSQTTTPAIVPVQSSVPSPARKTQSKTMQMTDRPKQEVSSPGAVPLQASGQVSRRPSITSLNRPETPISEKVSDNVSYTSASISRTNSPPPARIGSAPTRRVTKSRQKKERQERAKKAGESASQKEEPLLRSEDSVVQAPIIGRKKKTKKMKETGPTADSTPTVTRPPSPGVQENAVKAAPASQSGDIVNVPKDSSKQIKLPPIASLDPESSASATAMTSAPESDQGTQTQSTVANIFASLRASGELPPNIIETLFKPITSASHRFDQNFDPQVILNTKQDNLKLDQIACLDNDEPVVTVLDRSNAALILPNRRCLKGLTPAQAKRYKELYLQGARASISPSTREDQDSLDRLMPVHESSGERAPAPTLGMAELTTMTQLKNRFAEPLTPQAIPPAPFSVRLDASISGTSLNRKDKAGIGLEDAELAVAVERKNTEGLEKRLNALIRKNRRLVLGSGN